MFNQLHNKRSLQLVMGLLMGIIFGFLLQKGGATSYDVIIGQLLLYDWTVFKIMMSAVLVGMVGIYFMHQRNMIELHIKSGSIGSTLIGGLIFGAGFAILGYCPGTLAGACGDGALDAILGGIPGVIIGSGIFATLYPGIKKHFFSKGEFGKKTFPELFGINPWLIIVPLCIVMLVFFLILETNGL
ncbi:MAG: YeeE/YedE thiosulfate transporter family protein [Victivallaceae bacterium]|nr:YeeE/YedE thiosulfate transporter family protein [Victivallaceae bacterium]